MGVRIGEASNPGPSYAVYFIRAKMTPGVKGAQFQGERDYIGFTQKPPTERLKEHMDVCIKKVKGCKWLYLAEPVGNPVVTEDGLPSSFVSAQSRHGK